MFFRQIAVGPMQNFSYLIGCERTKQAAVIDCGFEADKIFAEAQKNGYRIAKILLTHVHYDHSGAAEQLSELSGAPILMNPDSRKKSGKSPLHGAWVIPEKTEPVEADDKIVIGDLVGTVIAAPGHQRDHLLFLFDPYLFCGDTLFIEGAGRTDFADSDPQAMEQTLRMLKTLPDHLMVCPGHDYGSVPMRTLGEEKRMNPHLV